MNIGANVRIGYFAQNQAETLDGTQTVFETIDAVAAGEVRKSVRTLLGSFLFSGDDVDKKVRVLSGGEKNRLAMCKLLLEPYSLLVLDEPTNHLDIRSKEVLKNALLNYDGTLIIVSHDRDFLTGMTNKTFEFRDKKVKQHIGDVNDYISNRKISSLAHLEVMEQQKRKAIPIETNNDQREKREKEKNNRRIQDQILNTEKKIEQLENEIKLVDEKLMNPSQYEEVVSDKTLFLKYEEMKKLLEIEMKNWEDLQKKLTL